MTPEPEATHVRIEPGTPVTIVKLRPDRTEAIRYPGIAIDVADGWVAARAPWGQRRVDLGYLVFEPNDIFLEYFALDSPFNVFAIYTQSGTLKGWYCNVTHPSWIDKTTIYWHDLYVDVVAYPDGKLIILDEDELAESGLATRDPALHQRILEARDTLVDLLNNRRYPFDQRL
jgi:hypothetical protein